MFCVLWTAAACFAQRTATSRCSGTVSYPPPFHGGVYFFTCTSHVRSDARFAPVISISAVVRVVVSHPDIGTAFFVRGSNESRYVATARSLGLFVPITVERRQPRWAGQANMGQKLYCHHRDQDRTTENRMPNLSTRLKLNRDWCSKSCYDCTV